MNQMSIIEATGVAKVYRVGDVAVRALDGVSLSIDEGEFSAIVGPSGSGKTTLLNIIGGLDIPSEGRMVIGGTDIGNLKPRGRVEFRLQNVGFVFQSYNLIPVLTVVENVEFIMLLQQKPKRERRERAMALLDAVGLADKAKRRPAQLSGGEQQRVTVARALAAEPKFVLADEPTANLDSRSAGNLLDQMQTLNQELNTTFIFSTHDPRVMERASRVITLEDGRIVHDGTHAPAAPAISHVPASA